MDITSHQTLLVVDDEEGSRQAIRLVFKGDYDVVMAESGEKAADIAKERTIDVAVVDICMKGMSGIELLHVLKRIDATTEVILITAYETLETARQALRCGARDYISKPFDVETIRQAVTNSLIHRRISKRVSEIEQQFTQLSQRFSEAIVREEMTRNLNQIYAGILHDVNNPLSVIQCFVDILYEQVRAMSRMNETQAREVGDKLGTISRQIRILGEVAGRHLELLRRSKNKTTSCSIRLVLHDLAALMNVHPLVRKGDIAVYPPQDDMTAAISSAELTQVLLNLVINAVQCARENPTVRVSARLHHHALDVEEPKSDRAMLLHVESFANKPPFISIEVADRSGGIPLEILNEIFEPYFSVRAGDRGVGLGLSIVSEIVRAAQGMLRVVSDPGIGSTFTVFIPHVSDEAPLNAD